MRALTSESVSTGTGDLFSVQRNNTDTTAIWRSSFDPQTCMELFGRPDFGARDQNETTTLSTWVLNIK